MKPKLIGTTLKSFFRLQKQEALIEQLSSTLHKKEQDIEKLCNHHYQEFVQSVDQLLQVRSDASQLKAQIMDFDQEFQQSAESLLDKKIELMQYRKISLNIDTALETMRQCLFVLDLASKASLLINNKKYYSALKILDELRQYHLPHIIQYEFAKHLYDCIPAIQDRVKEAVSGQMKEWLVNIRDVSRQVGMLAMEQTRRFGGAEWMGSIPNRGQNLRKKSIFSGMRNKDSSQTSLRSWKSIESLVVHEDREIDVTNNETVKVDFRPLYQCLHIHEVLGIRSLFRRHYEENRRLQASLVLTTPFSLKEEDVSGFESYLHDIIGFFIVEHTISSTTDGFRPRASVDALWDVAANKLYEVVVMALQNCENPDHYLKIKELMITFIQTAEKYSYSVTKLVDTLLTFFERYSDLLKSRASDKCQQAIEEDECNPVVVHTLGEYGEVHRAIKYQDPADGDTIHGSTDSAKVQFPKTLPFSNSLVVSVMEIKRFIVLFYQFSDGFHQQFNEMDDILKKGIELLYKFICVAIEEKVCSKSVRVSEVVRMLRNLEFFVDSVQEIDQALMDRRATHRLAGHRDQKGKDNQSTTTSPSKPSARSLATLCGPAFRDTRKKAEARLFEVMNKKVEDFVDCAEYDFCPTPPENAVADPSPSAYLVDLVNFLKTVWESTLSELSSSTKSLLYYSTFYNLSSALLRLLTQNPGAKRLSPIFLRTTFHRDLEFLRQFVEWVTKSSAGESMSVVPGSSSHTRSNHAASATMDLGDQLLEIQQALFLTTGIPVPSTNQVTSISNQMDVQVEGYLDPAVRSRKFSRLDRTVVVALLERVLASGVYDTLPAFEALCRLSGENVGTTKTEGGAAGWFQRVALDPAAERERRELESRRVAKRRSLETVLRTLRDDIGRK